MYVSLTELSIPRVLDLSPTSLIQCVKQCLRFISRCAPSFRRQALPSFDCVIMQYVGCRGAPVMSLRRQGELFVYGKCLLWIMTGLRFILRKPTEALCSTLSFPACIEAWFSQGSLFPGSRQPAHSFRGGTKKGFPYNKKSIRDEVSCARIISSTATSWFHQMLLVCRHGIQFSTKILPRNIVFEEVLSIRI